MRCYRQFIRGLSFYREGYIHRIMCNEISTESKMCYVRSKCYPSMKKGVYEQWILLSKGAPQQITKAFCSCPAGLGEGCTHIAGLLFAIEGTTNTEDTDVACTSKPCEWNKPSKRKCEPRPVEKIDFKRFKFDTPCDNHSLDRGPGSIKYAVKTTDFPEKLCSKLGNQSRAAIFDLLPCNKVFVQPEDDLNVGAICRKWKPLK